MEILNEEKQDYVLARQMKPGQVGQDVNRRTIRCIEVNMPICLISGKAVDPEAKIYPVETVTPPQPKIVTPAELQPGEIGVIVEWGDDAYMKGRFVRKINRNKLLFMYGDWNFVEITKHHKDCQIRILPKGTTLKI